MKQIYLLFFITILAGISVGMIVMKFDPYESSETVKFLFFAPLFVFMWGLGTLVFFILNMGSQDRWPDSFRRGLFLSALFLILILFKRRDIFSGYLGAGLGGVFIIIEALIYRMVNKRVIDEYKQ